jgi:hypothetical protein
LKTLESKLGQKASYLGLVRFQILMAESMKTTDFWDIALCSLTEVEHFRGAYCLYHHNPETLVKFYKTTRQNILKGCHL